MSRRIEREVARQLCLVIADVDAGHDARAALRLRAVVDACKVHQMRQAAEQLGSELRYRECVLAIARAA